MPRHNKPINTTLDLDIAKISKDLNINRAKAIELGIRIIMHERQPSLYPLPMCHLTSAYLAALNEIDKLHSEIRQLKGGFGINGRST